MPEFRDLLRTEKPTNYKTVTVDVVGTHTKTTFVMRSIFGTYTLSGERVEDYNVEEFTYIVELHSICQVTLPTNGNSRLFDKNYLSSFWYIVYTHEFAYAPKRSGAALHRTYLIDETITNYKGEELNG